MINFALNVEKNYRYKKPRKLLGFLFILFSTILGAIGFIVAGIIFIVKLCSIETLEVPYLTPISPLYPNLIKESILKRPRNKMKQRPNYLGQQDTFRMGDNNEN